MNLKKKQDKKLRFNQYDINSKAIMREEFENRKRGRTLKIIIILFILFLIGLYYNSEYATIRKITIQGNTFVSDYTIEKTIQVEETDFRIITLFSGMKKKVENIPGVEKVKIHNNPFQGLVINVVESDLIAFSKVNEQYFLIFKDGSIGELEDIELLSKVQIYPLCYDFADDLAEFALKFAKVKPSIRNQFSDIHFSDDPSDPEKITIYTSSGKIVYCRLDDMVNQLNHFNEVVAEFPNFNYYDFIGDNTYMG